MGFRGIYMELRSSYSSDHQIPTESPSLDLEQSSEILP